MPHRVTYTIMQNIMKMFHKAMKIRKYLRLSKNSLMLSPTNQKKPLLSKPPNTFSTLKRLTRGGKMQTGQRTAAWRLKF